MNTRSVVAVHLIGALLPGLVSCAELPTRIGLTAAGEAVRSRSSRDVNGCPVTTPPKPAFVPPPPYPKRFPNPSGPDADEQVWYGAPQLWTTLDSDGAVWSGLPVDRDGRVGDKTLWFSEEFSTAETEDFDGSPDITVSARRLGGLGARVVEQGGVPSFNGDIKNFLLVGLTVPEKGCWEVTARYQGAELSYVLLVDNG